MEHNTQRFRWLAAVVIAVTTVAAGAEEPRFQVESREVRLNERQPPGKIMDAVGIRPGLVIGEIGAGRGRMTMWLAQRIGAEGRIYANDIDNEALESLRRRADREGFHNIEVILGEEADPKLPADLDMIFMINVYHHVDDPAKLLSTAAPSLRDNATLVIVECDPDRADWGSRHGCTSRAKMKRELGAAGFKLLRVDSFLAEDLVYVAVRSSAATATRS